MHDLFLPKVANRLIDQEIPNQEIYLVLQPGSPLLSPTQIILHHHGDSDSSNDDFMNPVINQRYITDIMVDRDEDTGNQANDVTINTEDIHNDTDATVVISHITQPNQITHPALLQRCYQRFSPKMLPLTIYHYL